VYWGNGCQIIPPHDEGIAHSITQNLDLWDLPKVGLDDDDDDDDDDNGQLLHVLPALCCMFDAAA